MSCDFTEKVSLLIDGELPPIELRAAERHLLDCAECQQARADFLSVRSQISDYVPALAPAAPRRELARLLLQPAAANSRWREVTTGFFGPRRLTPALATVAATLLFVCAMALVFHFRSQRRGAGFDRTPPTVVQQQTPTLPSSGPANDNRESSAPKKPDQVVRNSEPQRKTIQRTIAVAVVKPDDAANESARAGNTPQALAPRENKIAPDYVATDASSANSANVRSADTETLTAQHVEQSELLLRAFRNLRPGSPEGNDLGYERRRAQQLFYQNVLLRREADAAGNVEVATLLESLEPILLDIANLSDHAHDEDVGVIKERVERKNLVALLQVNSTSMARANE